MPLPFHILFNGDLNLYRQTVEAALKVSANDFGISLITFQITCLVTPLYIASYSIGRTESFLRYAKTKKWRVKEQTERGNCLDQQFLQSITSFFLTLWFLFVAVFYMFCVALGAFVGGLSLEGQAVLFIGCIYVAFIKVRALRNMIRFALGLSEIN